MAIVFDATSQLLTQMIQGTALRHRVLAANLANVETPGYQAQEVSFTQSLEDARREQSDVGQSAPGVQAAVSPDSDGMIRRDGNNVDLDRQMAKLAQNTMWHNAMIQILTSRLSTLKAAIQNR